MVKSCCAFGCSNEWTPRGNIKFHKFPMNNPQKLKLWIQAVSRENFNPTAYTVICSEHFKEDDYLKSSFRKNFLKQDVVPSIFKFPDQIANHSSKRRKLLSRAPAALLDKDNPDWVPSRNMGYTTVGTKNEQTFQGFERVTKRHTKRLILDDSNVDLAPKKIVAGCPSTMKSLDKSIEEKSVGHGVVLQTDERMDHLQQSYLYPEYLDSPMTTKSQECLVAVKIEPTLLEFENIDIKDEIISEDESDFDVKGTTGESEQKPLLETGDKSVPEVIEEVNNSRIYYTPIENKPKRETSLERPIAYDVFRVCRTCLSVMKKEEAVPLVTQQFISNMDLHKKLTSILQLDLFPVENPCLCKKCEKFIDAVHDFKETCRVNEGVLKEFEWENKTKDLLHVVDQDDLEMKYNEAKGKTSFPDSQEIVSGSSLEYSDWSGTDWDKLWRQLDEKGNGLSDMEDHWYDEKEPKNADYSYAADASAHTTYNSVPEDDDLFSPSFDKYFQNVDNRESERLRKICRKFHNKDEGKGPILCELCGKIKDSKMSYKRHIKIHASHGGFQCQECKEVFAEWPSYVRHCKLVHGGFPRIFECQLCLKRYHTKKLLDSHMTIHDLENSKYCCFICKKVFNNKLNLEKHRSQHQTNKITCKFCGLNIYRSSLSRHIKLKHATQDISELKSVKQIFNCDTCDNKYFRVGSLNLHKKQCHNQDDVNIGSNLAQEVEQGPDENIVINHGLSEAVRIIDLPFLDSLIQESENEIFIEEY